ncbi:MAG: hypothetical protein HQ518_22695 [Rhodopirellula sp.]|nr:hypothetical protein [Rhodopirellula sp.]
MRTKFPVLWILQFLLLLVLGITSLCYPDFVLQYSRGMQPPEVLVKPTDELHNWILGLKKIPPPDAKVRDFFARMSKAETPQGQDDESETRRDGYWARNAAGASVIHRDAGSTEEDWTAVKKWILSCEPRLEDDIAWAKVTAWINAADEFPDPPVELLTWIEKGGAAESVTDVMLGLIGRPDEHQPISALRHLILDAQPTQATSWEIATDYVRQSGPSILGAALFTLFGMISASIRRPLARIFVLVSLFWTVGILWTRLGAELSIQKVVLFGGLLVGVTLLGTLLKQRPAKATSWTIWTLLTVWWTRIGVLEVCSDYHNFVSTDGVRFFPSCLTISIVTVAFLGITNAYYWLIGENEDPPQDDAGIAQGRPPQLWTIWMFQFVMLAIVGLFTLIQPHVSAYIFTQPKLDHLNTEIVVHSVRMLGVWVLALALFSYFALGSARDWIWQSIAWIFNIVFVTFAINAAINLNIHEQTIWAYLYGFQGVLFVALTWRQLRHKDPWSTENIESDACDWQWGDLSIGLPMLVRPLLFGRRTLYRQGVGAGGVFRMKPLTESDFADPELKGVADNEFFSQTREFPVQLRFSNRTQADDTCLDIRGCAMRLSVGTDSPLDMLFATGSFAPIRSLQDAWHILPIGKFEERIETGKTLREGLVAGLRRAPKSFTCLTYYNQLVLEWRVPDGNHYLVRFRLVPTSDGVSTDADKGLTDIEDLKTLWNQSRRPGEPRSADYLRQRLYDRLTEGPPVTYRLEAQFHAPQREDSLEWYDASLEWDERTHPWRSLGDLILSRLLTTAESDGLRFDPRNSPPSLRPPQGSSISDLDDPRTLATAQYRVNSILGRIRLWRRPSQGLLHTASDPPAVQTPVMAEDS